MALNTSSPSRVKLDVALSFLRPIVEYVRGQGKEVQTMLDILGVSEGDLSNPDMRVDDAVVEPLMAEAERLCQDSNIGLHIGAGMQASHLGVLGLLLLTCQSGNDAFELVMRYQTLVGNGGSVNLHAEGNELVLVYKEHPQRSGPYPRHTVESCLIGWASIAKSVGGKGFSLNHVTIACAPPSDSAEQERLFGCAVEYNAAVNSIRMPGKYADVGFLAGDPQLKAVLESQAKQRLQSLSGQQTDASPAVSQTKQFIADSIAYGVPSVDDAAKQHFTSARTLQRQLESAGKGYKELVEEVRADLASKYIQDPSLTLLDIALMLGFSEQSSFQRAFKRWFGKAPGAYRAAQA